MGKTTSLLRRFSHFFGTGESESLFHRLMAVFGETLDQAEDDLIRVMYAHWVDTAGNEGSRGFNTTQKGDLDKIFSLYLENLGGTSHLRQTDRRAGDKGELDDDLYRTRIRGLIEVLKGGASTREGIVEVVATNLGIVGDSENALAARGKIRVVEFLPEPVAAVTLSLRLFESFAVANPNVIEKTPEIRLRLRDGLPLTLEDPSLVNLATGGRVGYRGTVASGDALAFFADGSALLNGEAIAVEGAVPALPPGDSDWRFEAAFSPGTPVGVFDLSGSPFDGGGFAFSQAAVDLEMTLVRLTPGSFMVRIPWDIPGYTDSFDKLGEHPRGQIKYIVDKVKAAGVFAVIAYELTHREDHRMSAALTMRLPLVGAHAVAPGGQEHAIDDTLVILGVFDLTGFDSLNTFA